MRMTFVDAYVVVKRSAHRYAKPMNDQILLIFISFRICLKACRLSYDVIQQVHIF